MLNRYEKVLIQAVGLNVIELAPHPFLLLEAFALIDRVVEFSECVAEFRANDKRLESLDDATAEALADFEGDDLLLDPAGQE